MSNNLFIGKCIYCNTSSRSLTDEHVVPLALGGDIVLKDASCEPCRDITSRCERSPLNKNLAEVRAILDLPSRRRKFDSEIFELEVVLLDGTETKLELKRQDIVAMTQFLEFALPAYLSQDSHYGKGSKVTGCRAVSFGKNLRDLAQEHSIKKFIFTIKHKGNDFEIMIAKIAYCAVIAHFGSDSLKKCFVLPCIKRERDDVGFWFGCDPRGQFIPLIEKRPGKYAITLSILKNSDLESVVIARIKLFPSSDAPEYIVVVGILEDKKLT